MAACDMPGPLRHVKVPLTLDEHAGWMGYGRISSMQILEQSDPAILLFSVGAARVLGTLVLCKSTSSTIFLEVLFFGVFFFLTTSLFSYLFQQILLCYCGSHPQQTPQNRQKHPSTRPSPKRRFLKVDHTPLHRTTKSALLLPPIVLCL